MKTLVVYDSQFGNTHRVAKIIGAELGAEVLAAEGFEVASLVGVETLFLGSPTHGGRPTPVITSLIAKIPAAKTEWLKAACFDTRLAEAEAGFFLKLLLKTVGYAAPRMAADLRRSGIKVVGSPGGFVVKSKEGSLADKEEVKIQDWVRTVLKQEK